MNLYIFNPDNDLALANNDDNYHSPAAARQMGFDLTSLLGWLAKDGDYLLFPEKKSWTPPAPPYPRLNACFLPALKMEFIKDRKRWTNLQNSGKGSKNFEVSQKNFEASRGEKWDFTKGSPVRFRNPVTIHLYNKELLMPERVLPWGWNPSLIRQLTDAGMDASLLPSKDKMQCIKQVSHRSLAVRVLRRVRERASEDIQPFLCGTSREVRSEAELRQLIENRPDGFLMKAPLSGSGRGLIRSMGRYEHPVSGWCRNTLQTQGSVIVEPYYNKVCDFAMEFYAAPAGEVHFKGYSLFETNPHGSYTRNILLPDAGIIASICRYKGLNEQLLTEIQQILKKELTEEVSPQYEGFLGVDMMVCREEGRYKIHPCVEINARLTMGIFSRLFYDRYVSPDTAGTFQIRFSKKAGELQEHIKKEADKNPLLTRDNRFISGYLPLTPVDDSTRFLAEVNLSPLSTLRQDEWQD